jgi:hypothetical protein
MARLYEDGPLFEILWFPAKDDVPFKRGPNAISSNQWQADRPNEYDQVAVGEDPEHPRVFQFEEPNPLAIGGHVCGTPEDWAGDGVYDPEPPYVEYRPDGLPFCCGGLFKGVGGLVLGGEAYTTSPKHSTGGLVIGGSAYVVRPQLGSGGVVLGGSALVEWPGGYRAGYGGLVIGGSALVEWPGGYRAGYGGLVIGGSAEVTHYAIPDTCETALALSMGEGPDFELLASVGEYWFYYGEWPAGATMHVEWLYSGLYDLTFAVLGGASCELQMGIPTSEPHPGCYGFTNPMAQGLWLKILVNEDVPIGRTPAITTGPCLPPP